jgi:uncharacterized protein YqfA (UPF0365 family)
MPFALIIVVLIILFLALLFSFVPIGLLISASASGVKVNISTLVGMRLRKVSPSRIVSRQPRPAWICPLANWKPTIWLAAT